MSVRQVGTLFQDSIKFEAWPSVNINVWRYTFFGYCEPFLGWMHSDGADTIGVGTVENPSFGGFYVVDLISVTSGVDEVGVTKVMEVISFVGVLTKTIIEFH